MLRLVDCSLLVPPRPGPDGRSRYAMLETLRGYGAGLLADAGEQDQARAALARYAVGVAEKAAAGLQTGSGELAAARWLDAEDATMAHVLAWAAEHDLDTAVRLAAALGWWWALRGRLAGQRPLLLELARRAEAGQRRMVRRSVLARLDRVQFGRPSRSAGARDRGRRCPRGPGAVPGAGRLPGLAVGGA